MHYISICTRPMATKYGEVATYHEGFHTYSHINLQTCGHLRSGDKNYIYIFSSLLEISLFALDQWPPDMAKWQLTMREFHLCNHIHLQTCGHLRSRDKNYIPIFQSLLGTKHGRVLTLVRRFRTRRLNL